MNDRPCGLHAILASEEGAVAYYGVAQETLVGTHLIPVRVADHFEFRRISNQLRAGARVRFDLILYKADQHAFHSFARMREWEIA